MQRDERDQFKPKSYFYIYTYILFVFNFILLSHGFLSSTCLDIHEANNSGKLCTLLWQIIAYSLEKQDSIPKNKPKKEHMDYLATHIFSNLVTHVLFLQLQGL